MAVQKVTMLRLALIAILIAGQGLPSMARGTTLCLHADGGFCLEDGDEACCDERHHHGATAALGCCEGSPADTDACAELDGQPCDCTHLALADDPRAASRVWRAEIDAGDLRLRFAAINVTPLAGDVASLHLPGETPTSRASGPSAALSFLAPVMLRC